MIEAQRFGQFVRATAEAYGDARAIVLRREGQAEQALSFREVETRSAALAKGLVARGVGKGARIGFIFGNGPEFVLAFAAIARIGAIAVPISTLIRSNELVRVLKQSDVAGLLVQRSLLGRDYADRLVEALPELAASGPELRIPAVPFLRWIVSTGDGLPASIRSMDWFGGEARAGVDDALLLAIESEVHPTDQLVEIYTSGSMAMPKGVRHLHGAVLARARFLARTFGREGGTESPVSMPMFWVGGLGLQLLTSWAVGATSVCAEATVTNSLMAMGSVIRPEDLAKMGLTPPFSALGMSETFGPYSLSDELRVPGYPLCAPLDVIAEGFEMRVADEHGVPVADGAVGEIQVRGPQLSPGLHKLNRADYFTPDGFYHTGDLGLREGARVHFVGRDGDIIKTKGSNVSPAEVEMELQALDGVESAYVVGLPDAERGQVVVAAVVSRDGAALDADRLRDTLKSRLSGFKVPQIFLPIARGDVPMLHSNKVSRRLLTEMVADRLGRGATAAGPA